ncbi:MAG: hypothetical protein QXU92_01410 [Candidatus Diapherotrites archaeon]
MSLIKSVKKIFQKKDTAEEVLEKIKELEKKFHSKEILEMEYQRKQKNLELEFLCINLYHYILKMIAETKDFVNLNIDFLDEKGKEYVNLLKNLENSIVEKHKNYKNGKINLENWHLYLKEKNSETIELNHSIKSMVRTNKAKKTKEIIDLLEKNFSNKEKSKEDKLVEELFGEFQTKTSTKKKRKAKK